MVTKDMTKERNNNTNPRQEKVPQDDVAVTELQKPRVRTNVKAGVRFAVC